MIGPVKQISASDGSISVYVGKQLWITIDKEDVKEIEDEWGDVSNYVEHRLKSEKVERVKLPREKKEKKKITWYLAHWNEESDKVASVQWLRKLKESRNRAIKSIASVILKRDDGTGVGIKLNKGESIVYSYMLKGDEEFRKFWKKHHEMVNREGDD